MFLRPNRIFCSRNCRVLGIAFLLAATWAAWSVWPPQPELRVVVQNSNVVGSPVVSPNGRFLFCQRNCELPGDRIETQIDLFELPTGARRLSLKGDDASVSQFSPNWSHIVCWNEDRSGRLLALPSGDVVQSLPKSDPGTYPHVKWTSDGRHLLLFNPRLTVFRTDTGASIGHLNIEEDVFASQPNGSGFAILLYDRWQVLLHSFDPAVADTTVPLPGPSSQFRNHRDERPPVGSVSIYHLGVSNDGSTLFTVLYRHHQDGARDRDRRFLARWDRSTRKWTEADMGPVIGPGWQTLNELLQLDATGRFLNTWKQFHGHAQFGGNIDIDDIERQEKEGQKFAGRDLWDATTSPPKCLNDDGFPKRPTFLDPTGRRILLRDDQDFSFGLYDSETRALLNSAVIRFVDDPTFSADGKWVLSSIDEPWKPRWLPDQLAGWIEKHWPRSNDCVRVIRLADGKMVRQLESRSSPTFTTDGFLWTVTEDSRTGDTAALIAERWSPEAPGPPWWLLLSTGGTFAAIVCDSRRGRGQTRS